MLKINILGIFAIIPTTMFLMVSFFVLLGVDKTECENLKKFGRMVAVLLWICAALILILGTYVLITGNHLGFSLMQYLLSN